MEVEIHVEYPRLSTAEILTTLLHEFSAVTDYRTLRDSLPRRLASLLHCRGVLFYQRMDETLQFAAGSFDDAPGWSAALLTVAHINPIALTSNHLEAQAWRDATRLQVRQRIVDYMQSLRLCSTGSERWES